MPVKMKIRNHWDMRYGVALEPSFPLTLPLSLRERQKAAAPFEFSESRELTPLESALPDPCTHPEPDLERIPTGFRTTAQGCEERATLGRPHRRSSTPTGLCHVRDNSATTPLGLITPRTHFPGLPMPGNPGLEVAIPLGLAEARQPDRSGGESQRDSVPQPRVARNELPWAGRTGGGQ